MIDGGIGVALAKDHLAGELRVANSRVESLFVENQIFASARCVMTMHLVDAVGDAIGVGLPDTVRGAEVIGVRGSIKHEYVIKRVHVRLIGGVAGGATSV